MRKYFNIPAVLAFVLVLAGCDSGQYQIVTGPDGSLYRFNKKTGDLSMIMEEIGRAHV